MFKRLSFDLFDVVVIFFRLDWKADLFDVV
jgi:hypothetical protein